MSAIWGTIIRSPIGEALRTRVPWAALLPWVGAAAGVACGAVIALDQRQEAIASVTALVALVGGLALLRLVTRSVAAPLAYGGLFLCALWLFTPSERIVFASDRDTPGRLQIYAVDVGGGADRLSATPGQDMAPSVSPDGQRIVFTRQINGRERLFISGRQGEEVAPIPGGEGNDHHPVWSPDGHWIAFVSDRGGNWDLYVMALDGSQLRGIVAHPARDDWPSWSPDGRALAFESERGGIPAIWLVAPDGTELRPFRNDGLIRRQPAWSPDGRQLAFVLGDQSEDVCVAAIDDGPAHCLAEHGHYAAPAWSPSGRRLAYAARGDTGWDIAVLPATGGRPRDVSRHAGANVGPVWMSNGPVAALNRWWARVVG